MAYGFHSGSAVEQVAEGVYRIGVEALIPKTPPLASFDFEFVLPEGKQVVLLQGTSSFRAPCAAQYLATFFLNGRHLFPMNAKLPFEGGVTSLFIAYDGPIPTGDGTARVHIEADPTRWDSKQPTTWEFQGMLWLE